MISYVVMYNIMHACLKSVEKEVIFVGLYALGKKGNAACTLVICQVREGKIPRLDFAPMVS